MLFSIFTKQIALVSVRWFSKACQYKKSSIFTVWYCSHVIDDYSRHVGVVHEGKLSIFKIPSYTKVVQVVSAYRSRICQ
jgi:hypothetical protein